MSEEITGTGTATATGTSNEATQNVSNDAAPASQNDPNISNLISQRDRNYQEKIDAETRLAALENQVYKSEFIEQEAKKYPDVPKDVLSIGETPEQVKSIADKFLAHTKDLRVKITQELTTYDQNPRLPKETAAQRLKELEGSGKLSDAFDIMLNTER